MAHEPRRPTCGQVSKERHDFITSQPSSQHRGSLLLHSMRGHTCLAMSSPTVLTVTA